MPQLNDLLIYGKRNIHPLFSSELLVINHKARQFVGFIGSQRSADIYTVTILMKIKHAQVEISMGFEWDPSLALG